MSTVEDVLAGRARWAVEHGDSSELVRLLPPDSIDAIVTDPPAGIGFMGKAWDGDKGGRDAWIAWLRDILADALKALKPGGHALVWALPRTSHWTAMAVEDAGFEIRDVVHHLFGTGFPKSLDVSKAIDATERFGGSGSQQLRARDGNAVGTVGTNMHKARSGANDVSGVATAEAVQTDAARQWSGWGTALKPAAEHWILARKPLAGTVAANVLAHGTGALNIDGCRIRLGADEDAAKLSARTGGSPGFRPDGYVNGDRNGGLPPGWDCSKGRWPANVVLSHSEDCAETCAPGCAVAELDRQSGETRGGGHVRHSTGAPSVAKGAEHARIGIGHEDCGGASRYFYCAKPSRSEREAGCRALPVKTGGEATGREDGTAGLSSPRAGAGRTGGRRNHHPTVKSVGDDDNPGLMRWLVRLITPPGGVVLDLFGGSGSTGCAAVGEDMRAILFEREAEYVEIARARIAHAAAQPKQVKMDLFGVGT